MTNSKRALFAAGVLLVASLSTSSSAADDAKTVGRVHVSATENATAVRLVTVTTALTTRYAPAEGKRFADTRVISVRPRSDDPARFDATIYDYTVERAFDLVLDAQGKELSRKLVIEQPARLLEELADAYTIVREHEAFGAALLKGSL